MYLLSILEFVSYTSCTDLVNAAAKRDLERDALISDVEQHFERIQIELPSSDLSKTFTRQSN